MANLTGVSSSKDERNGKASYSLRESYDDGTSKSINIREVENGWLVCITREYYEITGSDKQYKYEEKEYISSENPIEKKKEDESKTSDSKASSNKVSSSDVLSSVSGFLSSMTSKLLI
jgi:hypothetical protein